MDRQRAEIVVGKDLLKGEESELNDFVGEFREEAGGKGWRWVGKGDEGDGNAGFRGVMDGHMFCVPMRFVTV